MTRRVGKAEGVGQGARAAEARGSFPGGRVVRVSADADICLESGRSIPVALACVSVDTLSRKDRLELGRAMFETGKSCAEIAKVIGYSETTLWVATTKWGWRRKTLPCRHCGVPVPARSNRANPRRCADCRLAYVRENVSGKRWTERADGRDDGSLTKAVVRSLFATAKKCPYCWQPMRSNDKSLDHKEPLSRGGWHSIGNVLVCCIRCNSRKHGRAWTEWLTMIPEPCAKALL